METWKDIEEFEDYYEISNLGRIRSKRQKRIIKGRILKGYNDIQLVKANKILHTGVHRLVAKAFIQNINNKEFVNHKDGNKLNNHVDNLEWVTPQENTNHYLKYICKKRNSDKKLIIIDRNTNEVISEFNLDEVSYKICLNKN